MDFEPSAAQRRAAERGRELGRRIAGRPGSARALLADSGLYGLRVPRALGGPGAGLLESALTLEGLAAEGAPLGELFALGAHLFGGLQTLLETRRLDRATAREMLAGRHIVAHAVTEAQAGSDLSAIACAARKERGGWRLSGRKSWVTAAPDASSFIVYAKTAPRDGLFGLSAFWVKAGAGVSVGPALPTLGLRAARAAALTLDAAVPRSALLGKAGAGRETFRRVIAAERAALPAVFLGQMERLIRLTLRRAQERVQFSAPLLRNQAVSHRLAEHQRLLEQSRLLLYRACWRLDRGQDAERDAALAKWSATESALRVALDCVQLHGAAGLLEEGGLAGELRDAAGGPLSSGSNDIQKEIVVASLKAR